MQRRKAAARYASRSMAARTPSEKSSPVGVKRGTAALRAGRYSHPAGHCREKKASAPLASAVLPFIVTKRAPRAFIVERTDYGWSVKAGAERLGLFVTQRQALTDVGRRRAELKASGQTTTLVVVSGSEPVLESRPFRAW